MRLTEISSLLILALAAALQARAGRARLRRFLFEAGLIGVGAWLAEDACIRLFHFYAYAPGWTVRLDQVPLLVAVIWPFVVLSARGVCEALPGAGRSRRGRWPLPLRAGLLICLDAALIEPVAVRAGLWSWSEPGLWGVPLIGIVGWGVFGAVALALLGGEKDRKLSLPVCAPVSTNVLLLVLWWGGFRWILRGAWPPVLCVALSAAVATVALFLLRARRGTISLEIMLPRAAAAALFFALLALAGPGQPLLWAYAAPFALPWLWLTRWRFDP